MNSGQPIPAQHVDVSALDEPFFEATAPGGSPGFGGPVTTFPNHGGNVNGVLEDEPHNAVHMDVGGLMQSPDTAAQDPIFWLHHANIDRLRSIWLGNQQHPHHNPTSATWLNESYRLHDVNGQAVKSTAAQVLDSTAAPLSYQYESLDDPRRAPEPAPAL